MQSPNARSMFYGALFSVWSWAHKASQPSARLPCEHREWSQLFAERWGGVVLALVFFLYFLLYAPVTLSVSKIVHFARRDDLGPDADTPMLNVFFLCGVFDGFARFVCSRKKVCIFNANDNYNVCREWLPSHRSRPYFGGNSHFVRLFKSSREFGSFFYICSLLLCFMI